MIILFYNLEEKTMVAMSVLPALLDTRAKKSDYKLMYKLNDLLNTLSIFTRQLNKDWSD